MFILAVVGAVAAGSAWAQSGTEGLKAKGCLNCHAMDKKMVGPAFEHVAAKYTGNQGAEGELMAKRMEGKSHPPVKASEADLQAAVRQVLDVK